ncbi:MAG: hypothetical protein QF441_08690 [Bacteriovoracaceae bacterium]|jgi:thiamine pyrophosphokinase|nr:hypothetical protein [Halobacteriovoraceae bacterium]MDP7320671.1 hypothetical protein [Bacteriovoracaceae bacterium]
MKIEDYLKKFNQEKINLVGPMPFSLPVNKLKEPVIYIDGGARFQIDKTGFSCGDQDSFKGKSLNQKLDPNKDFSDLAFVLKYCKDFSQLHLFGFLGGRKDHELFNLGEVYHFLKNKEKSTVSFENKIKLFSAGEWDIELDGLFSLVVFEKTFIELTGQCQYLIEGKEVHPLSSFGLSNQAYGQIRISTDRPFTLFINIKE